MVGETGVVDAEKVQHGGVEIVHRNGIFDSVVAEFVSGAVGDAAGDATASEPHGKAFDVVIAAVALCHRRAPEFSAPYDEGVVQHASAFAINDQGG